MRALLNTGVAVVVVLGVAAVSFWAGSARVTRSETPTETTACPPSDGDSIAHKQADLRDRLLAARRSVYVICRRGKDGGVTPGGTAWSVGPSLLATAAHVAEQIDEDLSDGTGYEYLVRSAEVGSQPLQVTSVQIHPGYRRWRGVAERGVLIRGSAFSDRGSFVYPCDCALLKVSGPVGPPPPRRLPIAASSRNLVGSATTRLHTA